MTTVTEIKNALINSKGVFLDGHNNKDAQYTHFGVMVLGEKEIVFPMVEAGQYSINPIRLVNGKSQLSTMSVSVMDQPGRSYKSQMSNYNERYKNARTKSEITEVFSVI